MQNLYIGLMSGTSMDGVDAVLVDFNNEIKLIASHHLPMPAALKEDLIAICQPGFDEINHLGVLDIQVAELFVTAVKKLLAKTSVTKDQVCAIGSHGQTIRHMPNGQYPFTLQIGDPNVIAAKTGITTVADFRRRDMAHGGQGAPLTPAFHNFLLRSSHQDRIVLNLGGIANVTYLPGDPNAAVIGFDTGPANTLLDAWIKQHLDKNYDANGAWAASGNINVDLLERLLADAYFNLAPPKSTGREYFNLMWLEKYLVINKNMPQDIQATLCELTAKSIIDAIAKFIPSKNNLILVAGGGAENQYLMERLKLNCNEHQVAAIDEYSEISSQWLEAAAFAWFAKQTMERKPGNLPSVTGAKEFAVLGGVYY